MKNTIEELTQTAQDAALKAGEILREGFGAAFEIMEKEGKNNLVTEYDYNAENAIISLIKERYPDHRFLAEESGKSGESGAAGVRWVIDPLDGTVNFAHGLPIFCVSVAAERDGELLCGVIYQPILDELFVAKAGKGAQRNGKPISVSANANFDSAFLVTGFPYNVQENPCSCVDHFVNVIRRGIPVRRLGSAALDLAYTACGRFDGFWEIDLNPWDVAAGVLLIREAGGKVTRFSGGDYGIFDQTILATNGKLHDEISEILSRCVHVKI